MATPQGTAERQGKLVTASRRFAAGEITPEELARLVRENTPDHAAILLGVVRSHQARERAARRKRRWQRVRSFFGGPRAQSADDAA